MRRPAFAAMLGILLVLTITDVAAQSAGKGGEEKRGTGSISGRITIGDKPAQEIQLTIIPGQRGELAEPLMNTVTNSEGQFTFSGLAAGSYQVVPLAPVYALPDESGFGLRGKTVALGDGESVTNIDFTLVRGGVITGRITDARDRPVIAERVNIVQLQPDGQKRPVVLADFALSQTDDRGEYRIYGLSPGRYLISVGQDPNRPALRGTLVRPSFPLTYHPGVGEESQATVVELSEGQEAAKVDIVLGKASKDFQVFGRIIDAQTGKGVANMGLRCGPINKDNRVISMAGFANSDAKGEFVINNLKPGRYLLDASSFLERELVAQPITFEITDSNVRGLELRVRRGATISGVVSVERVNDPALLSKLQQLYVYVSIETEGPRSPFSGAGSQIKADGSFTIQGVRAGKAKVLLSSRDVKGFSLLRVERDGVDVREAFEIAEGDNLQGVRLVLAYGTSVVRGEVKIEGGTLPDRYFMNVYARRPGDGPGRSITFSEVDTRKRFNLEGLAAGEYEIVAELFMPVPGKPTESKRVNAVQRVNISDNTETEITITLDLTAKQQGAQ